MAVYQCVSTTGSDSADGLSWATAKLTVQAAISACSSGGVIYVAPGDYTVTSAIQPAGHTIIGMGGTRNDLGYTYGAVRLMHGFSGDMIAPAAASWGNRIENVCLFENTYNQGGAAFKHTLTSSARGYLYLKDIQVTGYGWSDGIIIDGSSAVTGGSGGGYRSTWIENTYIFGTVNDSLQLNGVLHAWIARCGFNPAVNGGGYASSGLGNAAGKSYVRVLNAGSRDIFISDIDLNGDITTEASASSGVSPCYFRGITVTGNVTCAAGSNYNYFEGLITGSFTNNGGSSNKYKNVFTGTLS